METRLYRRQHEQILRQLNAIDALGPEGASWQFRRELSRLASLVKLHCSMLRDSLYPRLAEHEREEVRAIARSCSDRITTCGAHVRDFVERWDDDAIQRVRGAFLEEYYAVRDGIRDHIARERSELLDRIDPLRRTMSV